MWREGNTCADTLAKLGGLQNDKLVLMDKPFGSVSLTFLVDLAETMFVRPYFFFLVSSSPKKEMSTGK